MICKICKQFREENGASLKRIALDSVSIKALSAFENGRSSNIKYLELYFKYAQAIGKENEFMNEVKKGIVSNGD